MLSQGDKVPSPLFASHALESDDGKATTLAKLASQGPLVVYFYPRDDTPGCTREAQGFSAVKGALSKLGANVVGISKDSIASHCKFRDKYKLNFTLLSDPDLAVHRAFGAWGEKVMYGKKVQGVIRSTFIVENGKIARAFPSVKVDGHVEKVLDALAGITGKEAPAAKAASAKKSAPKKKAASAKSAKKPAKTAKKGAKKK